ncbi:hypothetical protein PCH70_37480 [Pseudomonas cichorii JBC1]|nr:hypothetical protein PCH70_37480 [Pseudomonas cichorii JBC1]
MRSRKDRTVSFILSSIFHDGAQSSIVQVLEITACKESQSFCEKHFLPGTEDM